MTVQMYGSWQSYNSFAIVSRAITWELHRRNVKGLVHCSSRYPEYTDCPWMNGLDGGADIGIAIAYPETGWMWLRGHDTKILFTVCEAAPIPPDWRRWLDDMSIICVPSEFCRTAFAQAGVTAQIEVVPHGIDAAYGPPPEQTPRPREHRREQWGFHLVHVTGAVSHPERKGTPQLLLAMKLLERTHPHVRLTILTPRDTKLREVCEKLEIQHMVNFAPTQGRSTVEQAAIYANADAVVQPSRGEGFGLCPLEARACGTPVVITEHAHPHFVRGVDVPVTVGPVGPLMTSGNEFGKAPTLPVSGLVAALRNLVDNYADHKHRAMRWAAEHGTQWSWRRVLGPISHEIARLARRQSSLSIGGEASLRGIG